NGVRLLVFQDVLLLICEATVNRLLFDEEEEEEGKEDNDEFFVYDEDGIGDCPLNDDIPDEL
ncbi:unnamed protein product, partial [Rotaria sp. Silwood1]